MTDVEEIPPRARLRDMYDPYIHYCINKGHSYESMVDANVESTNFTNFDEVLKHTYLLRAICYHLADVIEARDKQFTKLEEMLRKFDSDGIKKFQEELPKEEQEE